MKTSVKYKAFALIVALMFISVFLVIYPLIKTPTTIVNISIDDVELSMKDLYENPKYKSVFEQPSQIVIIYFTTFGMRIQ